MARKVEQLAHQSGQERASFSCEKLHDDASVK